MEVLAWGPTLTAERAAKSGATFMELDALLQAADIVTVQLSCPTKAAVCWTSAGCA